MEIVDIRTTVAGKSWKNSVYGELDTDEGIAGLNEAIDGPIDPASRRLRPLSAWRPQLPAPF